MQYIFGFQETVRDLEEQLEQEEQARQKLQLDKANVDQRVKNVETKLVDITVSILLQNILNRAFISTECQ